MRIRPLAAALFAAGLLFLAGCGSDDGSTGAEEPKDSPPAQAETTPAAEDSPGEESSASVPETLQFSAKTVEGKSFEAAELAGKPVVLWFWAPWCPICKAQSAETAKVAKTYAGQAHVVGVAGLDKEAAMRDFVSVNKVGGFPQLSDEPGEIWKKFKIAQQSVYVILDKDGKQVFSGVLQRGEGLSDKVADLVG